MHALLSLGTRVHMLVEPLHASRLETYGLRVCQGHSLSTHTGRCPAMVVCGVDTFLHQCIALCIYGVGTWEWVVNADA